jgi:hypothetical protein
MSTSWGEHQNGCQSNDAEILVDTLLKPYPELFQDRTAAVLLSSTFNWASSQQVESWLIDLKAPTWDLAPQAFGEVCCLYFLWFPERPWARTAIDELLANSRQDNEKALVGVSFVAMKLWHYPQYRETSSKLLDKLTAIGSKNVISAMFSYVSSSNGYFSDEHTEKIIGKFCDMPEFLNSHGMYNVVESMIDLVTWKPEFVYKLCMKVIAEAGYKLGDIQTSQIMLSGPLLEIALKLQAMGGENRRRGMDIFEGLMRFRAHEVNDTLKTIDGRPGKATVSNPPPSRRKRRRRMSS